VLTFIT